MLHLCRWFSSVSRFDVLVIQWLWLARMICYSSNVARSITLLFNSLWLAPQLCYSVFVARLGIMSFVGYGSLNSIIISSPWLALPHYWSSSLARTYTVLFNLCGSLTSCVILTSWLCAGLRRLTFVECDERRILIPPHLPSSWLRLVHYLFHSHHRGRCILFWTSHVSC